MKKSIYSVSLVFVALMVLVSGCARSPMPAPTSIAPNPFIGYWTQSKLSEHPLGMTVCGNFQTVEFFEDGTFTVTNDFSGLYKEFDPGFGPSIASGKYKVLGEKKIEIKYGSDNVTEWEYILSGNALTMSSPVPDELGGGLVACYFSKSSK